MKLPLLDKMRQSPYLKAAWWSQRLMLIIRNEDNFAERLRLPYTPTQAAIAIVGLGILITGAGLWLGASFFSRVRYTKQDAELARRIVALNITVDSLANALQSRNQYVENLRKVFGNDPTALKEESSTKKAPKNDNKRDTNDTKIDLDRLAQSDVRLRQEIETSSGQGVMAGLGQANLRDLQLFPPVKGVITQKYDSRTQHYGIDIVAEKDAPLKSVADGTVIMAAWTDETGYVITIQHAADLISVYKHCSVLLKKNGEVVRAGEIVAIIGNSGELTTGSHVHFELWYGGNPLNPEKFLML